MFKRLGVRLAGTQQGKETTWDSVGRASSAVLDERALEEDGELGRDSPAGWRRHSPQGVPRDAVGAALWYCQDAPAFRQTVESFKKNPPRLLA